MLNAFVDATPISTPARVMYANSHSRTIALVGIFAMLSSQYLATEPAQQLVPRAATSTESTS